MSTDLWRLSPLFNSVRGVVGVEVLCGFRRLQTRAASQGSTGRGVSAQLAVARRKPSVLPRASVGPPYGALNPNTRYCLATGPDSNVCTPPSWNLHIGVSGHVRSCKQSQLLRPGTLGP